ncbi:hypothetical protein F0562_030568 [Nyssa sinensis]|uniref:Uncharacterized protein n=1 Tax=Nyssa sinensis TaxID=561372 RepID=A0A5J5B039_9ASTE|nr:hypothetical protein F0562_030568 [Nyssa sinensis]
MATDVVIIKTWSLKFRAIATKIFWKSARDAIVLKQNIPQRSNIKIGKGIEPAKPLLSDSKYSNVEMLPIDDGMEPERLFCRGIDHGAWWCKLDGITPSI